MAPRLLPRSVRLAPVVASAPGTVVPRKRTRGHVASAVRMQRALDNTGYSDPAQKRMKLGWQERAFQYYELLGEIWYAAQFYARALQKLELKMVRQNDAGDWDDVDDPAILSYLERIQDPGGGRSNLLGSYGRLTFLAGECYLLVTREVEPDSEDDEGDGDPQLGTDVVDDEAVDVDVVDDEEGPGDVPVEVWEMLSCDELRWNSNDRQYERYRLPNTQPETINETPAGEWEPLPDTGIAYRFWTRHPRYSNLPDGPMRGVLDLCEELVILTRAVRARGRSRLTGAGLLLVPDEMTFPSDEASDPDEDPNKDVFLDRLTQGMMAGIADEGSASAVMPIVARVGAEWIDKFKLLRFFDPAQVYPETGLRTECIQRIAIGLDLPPEILLGKGGANHWSAWQIDEDSWTAHLQPVAQKLVDDLTGGYLRPTLRANGVADWGSYAIAYDASAIIQHPDRARDAKDAWDRGAINWTALRGATGFDDEDAMSEEEYRQWVGIQLRDAGLAVDGEVTVAPTPIIQGPAGPDDAVGTGPADTEQGPPEAPPDDDETDEPVSEVASAMVQLAVELIAERGRELGGSRLRNEYRGDARMRRLLLDVPNRDVGPVVGSAANGDLAALQGRAHNLVAGAGECFRPRLASWGLSPADVEMVVAVAEQHAAGTLFDAEHA